MSTVAQSPSPSKIVYTPRPNHAAGEIVWGFWITVDGRSHYADWAMPTGPMVEMARADWQIDRRTAAYQYYMPSADSMTLRPTEATDDDALLAEECLNGLSVEAA